VTLCSADNVGKVIEAIDSGYTKQTGLKASFFVCQAGDGARKVDLHKYI
jgi:galactokinase